MNTTAYKSMAKQLDKEYEEMEKEHQERLEALRKFYKIEDEDAEKPEKIKIKRRYHRLAHGDLTKNVMDFINKADKDFTIKDIKKSFPGINSSSVSATLWRLSNDKEFKKLKVVTPGKGRRATVFQAIK